MDSPQGLVEVGIARPPREQPVESRSRAVFRCGVGEIAVRPQTLVVFPTASRARSMASCSSRSGSNFLVVVWIDPPPKPTTIDTPHAFDRGSRSSTSVAPRTANLGHVEDGFQGRYPTLQEHDCGEEVYPPVIGEAKLFRQIGLTRGRHLQQNVPPLTSCKRRTNSNRPSLSSSFLPGAYIVSVGNRHYHLQQTNLRENLRAEIAPLTKEPACASGPFST